MDLYLYIFTCSISLLSMLIITQPIYKNPKIYLRFLTISVILMTYSIAIYLLDPSSWQGTFFTLLYHLLVIICLAYTYNIDYSTAVIVSAISFIIFIVAETISYSICKIIILHNTPYDRNLVISTYLFLILIIIIVRITVLEKISKIFREKIQILKKYAIVVVNFYVIFSFLKELAHYKNAFSLYGASTLIVIISSIYLVKELTDYHSVQRMILYHRDLIETVQPIIQDIKSTQHDFRNQLNVLRLKSKTENEYKQTSDQLHKFIDEMDLIDSFTSFGGNGVSSLLYLKKKEALSKNIEFIVNKSPFLTFKILLTEYELVSVLSNLIDNAIEASKQYEGERKVMVSFKADSNRTLVSIANTGNGISDKILSRLFKRGISTKSSEAGMEHGYGLYNVKKILDQYGEKIEVLSEDNLTTFQVHFSHAAS